MTWVVGRNCLMLSSADGTELATRMVREWGLSPRLGPVGYGPDAAAHDNPLVARPYAELTRRTVDREVVRLLREAEEPAGAILPDHRDVLGRRAAVLRERETIDGHDLDAIVGRLPRVPSDAPVGALS